VSFGTMAAAELEDASVAMLDIQTSIATGEAASSLNNNNKRKRGDDDDDDDGNNNQAKNNTKTNNNNKRRKKKKGGTSHQHRIKQKRNWIESCSESITRIPTNCAAPVTCVITRSEIEEEPLLPKQINNAGADGVAQNEDTNTLDKGDDGVIASAEVDCTCNSEPKQIVKTTNIASLTKFFTDAISKEPKQPWKIETTITVDGEEKKLFIPVQRHSSANGPTKWQQKKKMQGNKTSWNYFHLPDGDNGDGKKNPYPKETVPDKFWAQRKRLFSRYDEGIQIGGEDDPEMWYSVTPESIGLHIANRMFAFINLGQKNIRDTRANDMSKTSCNDSRKEIVIIDAFCGCGGNSIAFARLNDSIDVAGNNTRVKVIAVDNNLSRLNMAANNAAVYGICKEDVVFVHADVVEVVNVYKEGSRKKVPTDIPTNNKYQTCSGFSVGGVELLPDHVDALFLSPPWGGLDYDSGNSNFDPVKEITLESKMSNEESDQGNVGAILKTNGGELLFMAAKAVLSESKQEGLVVTFLPRNIDGISVSRIAVTSGVKGSIELEQNVVNGKVKTVTAYLGPCVNKSMRGGK